MLKRNSAVSCVLCLVKFRAVTEYDYIRCYIGRFHVCDAAAPVSSGNRRFDMWVGHVLIQLCIIYSCKCSNVTNIEIFRGIDCDLRTKFFKDLSLLVAEYILCKYLCSILLDTAYFK